LWDGEPEIFEMPPESRFDIDEELDFIIAEKMMKYCEKNQNKTRKKYGSE
jgi:CMP-N-acetylneuraminic acid synthetase